MTSLTQAQREEVIKTLAEFFLDSFAEDAAGVADWIAQGGQDVDMFYEDVKLIKADTMAALTALERAPDGMREALERIERWELPATNKFWDREKTQPVSYEAEFGSNGAREFIRCLAREALAGRPLPTPAAPPAIVADQ
jgi:hypothetical protein